MAVIIDMDMPKSCLDCKLYFGTKCPITNKRVSKNVLNNTLHKDCPLKSADEMIEEIEHRKEALDYTLNILVKGDSMEERLQGAKEAVEEMIEIAHKYCDKEGDT